MEDTKSSYGRELFHLLPFAGGFIRDALTLRHIALLKVQECVQDPSGDESLQIINHQTKSTKLWSLHLI